MLAQEPGLTQRGTFQVHVRSEVWMKNQTKAQPAKDAERYAVNLADDLRQRIEVAGKDARCILARARAVADGDRVAGMSGNRGLVRREVLQALGQIGNGPRQIPDTAAGDVLFIQVVLLQEGEPLQLGVGFGKREHSRVARSNRLHLGIGEFLGADVFGTAGGVFARHDLGDKPGLGL